MDWGLGKWLAGEGGSAVEESIFREWDKKSPLFILLIPCMRKLKGANCAVDGCGVYFYSALANKTFGHVLMGSSGGELGELLASKREVFLPVYNGSKKCISLAIDLLYLWIWGLLGCRGSIKTQRQRYIRNDVMLAGPGTLFPLSKKKLGLLALVKFL
ncbi:hypothetical protein ACJX0J_018521, partial [Zea mays]